MSKHILKDIFNKVDLMDQCEKSIQHAALMKSKSDKIDEIHHCSMEEFTTEKKYNLIVLRYCIGYLDRQSLKKFLMKLATMLRSGEGTLRRA